MKELFLSECRRLGIVMLIAAGVHLVAQLFLNRLADFPQMQWQPHFIAATVYMLCGLALGLYQWGTWRQASRWIWLLHRPMSRVAIFAALGLAACALLALAIALPLLVALATADLFTPRVIDLRHYLAAAHALVLAVAAWLVGGYTVLNRSYSAIVLIVLPLVALLHLASAVAMLVPAVACLALLAVIVYGVVKPDRTAPPESPAMLLATAVPLQVGFYFALLWGGSMLFQYGQIFAGIHPLNTAVPPAGGYTEASRAEGADLFRLLLRDAKHPRALQWHHQVGLSDIFTLQPELGAYPVRHQASNFIPLQWTDAQRRILWTFSHDSMRFEGIDPQTGAARGVFGRGGIGSMEPFATMPFPVDDRFLVERGTIHAIDADTGRLHAVFVLPAGETFLSPPRRAGRQLVALTDRRLLAYPLPEGEQPRERLAERLSVALPHPPANLDRIDIAELADGLLLSFTHGRDMHDGVPGALQAVLHARDDGRVEEIGRRRLSHDFGTLFEHKAWWISPALHAVLKLPDLLLDKGRTVRVDHLAIPRPPHAVAAALLASLASLLGGWWWLRRARLSRGDRIAWLASCAALGPPALLSLMVLQPRAPAWPAAARERPAMPQAA